MAFNARHKLVHGSLRSELKIYDITGNKTIDNPDGWGNGTTNPLPTEVTAAQISFYFSDGSVSLNNNIYNPSTPFPNALDVPAFLMSTAMILPQTNYPDGLVRSQYRVDGEWIDPTTGDLIPDAFFSLDEATHFFYKNVECCVEQAFANVDVTADPCKDRNWKIFLFAQAKLDGLIDLISCKKWNKATVVLTELQEFCSSNDLKCGC